MLLDGSLLQNQVSQALYIKEKMGQSFRNRRTVDLLGLMLTKNSVKTQQLVKEYVAFCCDRIATETEE